MVALRSRLRLGFGTALAAAGVVLLALAFTPTGETYEPASVTEETSAATLDPEASFSQSLGVAGGILFAAGLGVAFLAFSDFGRPSRR